MYQQIVLATASIILIITLIFIGIAMSKGASNVSWPPIVNNCPDYWIDEGENGEQCVNTHRLGTCNIPSGEDKNSMNFNVAPYIGDSGTCAKYDWATACGVTWDGITSGIANPCV